MWTDSYKSDILVYRSSERSRNIIKENSKLREILEIEIDRHELVSNLLFLAQTCKSMEEITGFFILLKAFYEVFTNSVKDEEYENELNAFFITNLFKLGWRQYNPWAEGDGYYTKEDQRDLYAVLTYSFLFIILSCRIDNKHFEDSTQASVAITLLSTVVNLCYVYHILRINEKIKNKDKDYLFEQLQVIMSASEEQFQNINNLSSSFMTIFSNAITTGKLTYMNSFTGAVTTIMGTILPKLWIPALFGGWPLETATFMWRYYFDNDTNFIARTVSGDLPYGHSIPGPDGFGADDEKNFNELLTDFKEWQQVEGNGNYSFQDFLQKIHDGTIQVGDGEGHISSNIKEWLGNTTIQGYFEKAFGVNTSGDWSKYDGIQEITSIEGGSILPFNIGPSAYKIKLQDTPSASAVDITIPNEMGGAYFDNAAKLYTDAKLKAMAAGDYDNSFPTFDEFLRNPRDRVEIDGNTHLKEALDKNTVLQEQIQTHGDKWAGKLPSSDDYIVRVAGDGHVETSAISGTDAFPSWRNLLPDGFDNVAVTVLISIVIGIIGTSATSGMKINSHAGRVLSSLDVMVTKAREIAINDLLNKKSAEISGEQKKHIETAIIIKIDNNLASTSFWKMHGNYIKGNIKFISVNDIDVEFFGKDNVQWLEEKKKT